MEKTLQYTFISQICNKELIKKYSLNNLDVILMSERKEHIIKKHPQDYEIFLQHMESCINNPSFIIEDLKNEATVFFSLKLKEDNINIIIRLSLCNKDPMEYKNSIITAYRINDHKLKKLILKNKLIYIKP